MPVITPTKKDVSDKLNTSSKGLTDREESKQTNQTTQTIDSDVYSRREKVTTSEEVNPEEIKDSEAVKRTEQGTKQEKTGTRMVQAADQWRKCSKPHRI